MTCFLNGKSWTHSMWKLNLKSVYDMDPYYVMESSTALVFGLSCALL